MAHNDAGVPVEAAASLFAGNDAAVDFFSSSFDVSQSEPDNSPVPSSSHDSGASSLFEAGPVESTSSLFQSTSQDSFLSDTSGVLNSKSNLEAVPESQPMYTSTTPQSQGWQDERGQWHSYDGQNQYTSTYDYASQRPSTDPSHTSYATYYAQPHVQSHEQPRNYAVPQSSDTSKSPTVYMPQQNLYQPGHTPVPPTPPAQPPYVPFQTAAQGGVYGQSAYKSYTPGFASPVDTKIGGTGIYPGQTKQSSQGAKDVNAYRPTTLNAYDPPIPSKSRSKIRAAHAPPPPPLAAVPNGMQYSYTGAPQRPPSLPPPPMAGVRSVRTPVHSATDPVPNELSSPHRVTHPPPPSAWSSKKGHVPQANMSSYGLEDGAGARYGSPDSNVSNVVGQPTKAPVDGHVEDEISPRNERPTQIGSAQKDYIADHVSNSLEVPGDAYDPEANMSVPVQTTDSSPIVDTTSYDARQSLSGVDARLVKGSQHSVNTADIGSSSFSPPLSTTSPVDVSPTAQVAASGETHSEFGNDKASYDPYHPVHHSREGTEASHTRVTHSTARPPSTKSWDPYLPPKAQTTARSDSISSTTSTHDTLNRSEQLVNGVYAPTNPYAATSRLRRSQSQHSDLSYGEEPISRFNYNHDPDLGSVDARANSNFDPDTTAVYSNTLTAPTYTAYAPSPSLLGTNDPLGRASARVPLISFGFGGKLVSCFHSAGESASGFDISLTARQSRTIQLRTLHEVIPASAMDSFASSYPGPLLSDPGIPSMSLARTVGVGTASNVKTKKTLVSKWLAERAEELSSGVAFIPSGSQERYNAEGKLVLVRLLKAMVDNDGQLSGSPSIEWAVRSALLPYLESESPAASNDLLPSKDRTVPSYTSTLTDFNEPPLAIYHLRPSALDRIQAFLLRGERRLAYHYALDEKLWAHAMLIASSIDTQAWKEVVNEFIHSELAVKQPSGPLPGTKSEAAVSPTNGRESLRVAYSFFAGQGAAAVQELTLPKPVGMNKDSLLAPSGGLRNTPISPNFPKPALTASVPPEALAKWQEAAAVMAFSQHATDSAALTTLGDYLAANRWNEAAHACYLLSPRTSSLGGAGVPSVRIVLVGCENPTTLRNFNKDLDVTLFSEVVEFALSLSPTKGQDGFCGLPHLQAYKLIRASHLAEMGHVEIANRYCEAIGSVIRASARGSQFYTPTFIGELKDLSDRLTAAPQQDTTVSWISRTMAKPSLDTIGSWLEGRFSKLIVGDGEDVAESSTEPSKPSKTGYGPFSHYSTISSVATSASPSPSPTPYGVPNSTAVAPGMAFASHGGNHVQIDRASSAMDHLRPEARRTSPVPRVASANAATTTFAQAYASYASTRQNSGIVNGVPEGEATNEIEGQDVTWWGSSSLDRSGPTPTAATFHKVNETETAGNFVSLMDDGLSEGTTPMATSSASSSQDNGEEDVEDLGFGNSSTSTPKSGANAAKEEKEKPKEQPKPTPEVKPQSASWFGRWWYRSSESTQTGPIKAKLGEETSFYYDKELKRWVNRKAGATETAAPPPPPPPSRPRTASPGSKTTDAPLPPKTPPQARPASAADVPMPPRKPPRVRSNLVPKEDSAGPGSAPPSATSFETSGSGPSQAPPAGISRPKSSASKRNVRSRYVDVFQQ